MWQSLMKVAKFEKNKEANIGDVAFIGLLL
jgi:hypothetical protein